jgi:aryl-alcohol dehydrogenase-like predicted oxidoreductase
MNLILGTATFGTKYGIANQSKSLSDLEAVDILEEAKRLNIGFLDTAPAYGDAESIVGNFHRTNNTFEVISKISEVHDFSSSRLINQIRESATALKLPKFSAVLFHKPEVLTKYPKEEINRAIERILGSGLVESLGASVYEEEEIRFISRNFPGITLFQVPENIMDRRLLNSSLLMRLAAQGIKFHVRSIFLQGLLLMEMEDIPTALSKAKNGLSELYKFSELRGVSIFDLCLNYSSRIEWASGVVVGVNSQKHLQEIVNFKEYVFDLESLPSPFPKSITDPREWVLS